MSFDSVFALRDGWCGSVRLSDPLAPEAWQSLPREERLFAESLSPLRQRSWIAGRIALRSALERLGASAGPILSTPRGAPLLPAGIAGSISHKSGRAVAWALRSERFRVGIDLEPLRPVRKGIERNVLTDAERTEVLALSESQLWENTLLRFSIKEAIYKAVDPYWQRWVGFEEVSVFPRLDGGVRIEFALEEPAPLLEVDAWWRIEEDEILAIARAAQV